MAINKINFNNVEFQVGESGGGSSSYDIPNTIAFLGDSIMTENFGQWYSYLIGKYNIKKSYNLAHGGARWAHGSSSQRASNLGNTTSLHDNNIISNEVYNLIDGVQGGDYDEPDIVFIHAGINDVINNSSLERVANVFDYANLPTSTLLSSWTGDNVQTVAGGMRFAIEALRSAFPTVRIIITTPLFMARTSYVASTKAMNELMKEVAGYLSVPVIDLTYESGFIPNMQLVSDTNLNETAVGSNHNKSFNLYLADNTHPNQCGARVIADIVGAELMRRYGRPLYDYHWYSVSGTASASTLVEVRRETNAGTYGAFTFTTDANGAFGIKLPAGDYKLKPNGGSSTTLNLTGDVSGITL